MIVKHVPMRSLGKSNFDSLVSYITDAQSKTERLGLVALTHCEAGTITAATDEMLATQHMNTRATGDKTYHLVVSFRAGENPNEATLKAIEESLCKELGFDEHQRISAVHHDTDNLHMHIAINKIHPERYTMHEPFQAYRKLSKLCVVLEDEHGLEKDNHIPKRSISEGRAADLERHSGIESLVGWIKRECLQEIKGAQSWGELQRVLQDNDLTLRAKGNGFVFESGNGTTVKASTVSRDLSKSNLEARFGQFEASQVSPQEHPPLQKEPVPGSPFQEQTKQASQGSPQTRPIRAYRKEPIHGKLNTDELYAKYQSDQQNALLVQRATLDRTRRNKSRKIDDAKRFNRLRRASIKLMGGSAFSRKLLYSQASKALRNNIQAINKEYQKERQSCYEKHKRQTWADWLKSEALQGNDQALATLRAREAAVGIKGNAIKAQADSQNNNDAEAQEERIKKRSDDVSTQVDTNKHSDAINGIDSKSQDDRTPRTPSGITPTSSPEIDNITKQGTVIFRAGRVAIRDDGSRLQVSRKANNDGLQAALQLAMVRYGNSITVNGTSQFKAQVIRAAVSSNLPITFFDPALESRRQALLIKENTHGKTRQHQKQQKHDSRRRVGFGIGQAGSITFSAKNSNTAVQSSHNTRATERGRSGKFHAGKHTGKQDVSGIGRVPPPHSRNRLRTLSSLGVVRATEGSEMLLPSDVPGYLEQQRTQSNNALRWGVSGSGDGLKTEPKTGTPPATATTKVKVKANLKTEAKAEKEKEVVNGRPARAQSDPKAQATYKPEQTLAMDNYIAERESKRLKGIDVPKHVRYVETKEPLSFAGIRNIDGQSLALLKRVSGEIMVMPIDSTTARRMKRVSIGAAVVRTATGSIKASKARSR